MARHADFRAVFGTHASHARHQCAEVQRSQHRRWMRMLGARHDVQIWGPDERAPPPPRALVVGTVASVVWVQQTLTPLRERVSALRGCEISVVEVTETHALLFCVVGNGLKELVLLREPPTLHVYAVLEHGRQWFRSLEFTTDTAHCLADLPASAITLGTHPRPHWQAGDAAREQAPAASLVIMRSVSKEEGSQIFVARRPPAWGCSPV